MPIIFNLYLHPAEVFLNFLCFVKYTFLLSMRYHTCRDRNYKCENQPDGLKTFAEFTE